MQPSSTSDENRSLRCCRTASCDSRGKGDVVATSESSVAGREMSDIFIIVSGGVKERCFDASNLTPLWREDCFEIEDVAGGILNASDAFSDSIAVGAMARILEIRGRIEEL